MTITVEVNEVRPESWTGKDGKQKTALRLSCIDKDPDAQQRYKNELLLAIDRDQEEFVTANVRRDTRISLELHEASVFGTQVVYRGRVVPSSVPALANGKLKIEKPSGS